MKGTVLFIGGRQNPHERLAELRSARSLGLDIILLTRKIPFYVRELIVEGVEVDLDDYSAVESVAVALDEAYHFKGVVAWSETDVPLKNRISRTLGLPSMSEIAVLNSRNKVAMRKCLSTLKSLIPLFHEVNSLEEARVAALNIGFPVIIKPSSGSGSKGIFKVNNDTELESAVANLRTIATKEFDSVFQAFGGTWVVEEFLDGIEYSVEGYVYNNIIQIVGLTDYESDELTFVETSHIFPSNAPEAVRLEIEACAKIVVSAMGINNTTFHLECKYTKCGFKLIECAARPAGGYISTHLAEIGTGNSHLQNYIKVCCGVEPSVVKRPNNYIGIRYLYATQPGIYMGIDNIELTLSDPVVQHLYLHFKPGQAVALPPDDYSTQRVGAIIGISESYQKLNQVLTERAAEIKVKIV